MNSMAASRAATSRCVAQTVRGGMVRKKGKKKTTLTSCCWRVLFRRPQKWLHPLHRMFSDVTTFSKIVSSLVVEGNELTQVCLHRDVSSSSAVVVD